MSEPEKCPVCKAPVTPGDTVDMQKCGPDYCEICGWNENDPMNHGEELE